MKVRKRRWTPEELELVQQAYGDPDERAVLPDVLGRSLSSIRDKLYRTRKAQGIRTMRRRVRPEMQESHNGSQPSLSVEELAKQMDELRNQFAGVKDAFEELSEQLQSHMRSFGQWLIEIGEAYVHGVRPVSMHDVMAENRKLKFEIQTLQQVIRRHEELMAEQLREIELLVEQFTHLASIQKIASLGEFLPRLRLVINKFGEVLHAKIDIPALSDVEGEQGSAQALSSSRPVLPGEAKVGE